MPDPVRVALVLPSLMVGGAERHVVNLCQHVDRTRVRLSLMVLRQDLPHELHATLPEDVPVHVAPFARRNPALVPWLVRRLTVARTEVAESFLWYADAITTMACLVRRSVPLIVSERGERTKVYYSRARRVFDRRIAFPLASAICVNSEFGSVAVVQNGGPPAKVRLIRNGVDSERLARVEAENLHQRHGWPGAALVVGMVARLVPGKGATTLVRAMAMTSPAIRAVFVGDGPLRPELEALVDQLGLRERVAFVGKQIPAGPFMAGCDVVVALSDTTEHCSNSILEALALGKSVVATAVGGNPELVRHGATGVLVPPRDPASLARVLDALAVDVGYRERLGSAARALSASSFSMAASVEAFTRMWEDVAARTRQPGGARAARLPNRT